MVPKRLSRLEHHRIGGIRLFVARSAAARLTGLAWLRAAPSGCGLLIPRCRSVHTFGMGFALDILFLDARGSVLAWHRDVPPRRVLGCAAAAAVLEAPAGEPGLREKIEAMAEEGRLRAALDPRVPIYRDTYNEYFVFILSAGGAAAGTQVPLYVVMAIAGLWSPVVFTLACIVFELAVIFGLARPQMKPVERVGWAALWSGATAALALCFYYLVAEPTL